MRTDENNNPAAFTTQLAIQAGLVKGTDWEDGTPFPAPSALITAKLLGDPIALTIKVIDAVGYETQHGFRRWQYILIPKFIWDALSFEQKRDVIGFHYLNEGGTEMKDLFPNYGKR